MFWRDRLVPASFRGAFFHIEQGGPLGGRRIALHEYPKRDLPYAEDMGRRARRFSIAAYVIGPFYIQARDALLTAMEIETPGLLIHPTMGEFMVNPEIYSCNESRERGGIAEFELGFIEAGTNDFLGGMATATQSIVGSMAGVAGIQSALSADAALGRL